MDLGEADNEKIDLCLFSLFLVGVSCFILGLFSTNVQSRLFKWLGIGRSDDITCFQNDITDIKKTSMQIAQEWVGMTDLIRGIQDYQAGFAGHFQSEFQAKCEGLSRDIGASLHRGFSSSGDSMAKLIRTVEVIREDIVSLKICMLSVAEKCEGEEKSTAPEKIVVVHHAASQTQSEKKDGKRVKEAKAWNQKDKMNSENETSKFIASVKKCMTDVIKNSKLQLQVDQEEHNRELEFIFSKLAEDRDDIKRTILQAYSVAAEQAKKNQGEFEHIGQEALHYIAVLNQNTNNMLKTKLEDADGRLKEILNALKRQNFDVTSIRETLENVDGQFEHIFQRVELGCVKNTEHCEEMAQSLEAASSNWMSTASELDKFCRQFTSDSRTMKELLAEMKNIVDYVDAKYVPGTVISKGKKGKKDVLPYESAGNFAAKDLEAFSQKGTYLDFMNSLMRSCWERLSSMNERVESGCDEICEIVDTLKRRFLSLNGSLTKLDDILGSIDLDSLAASIASARCHDEDAEEILRQTRVGDASGDALPFQQAADGTTNGAVLERKLQSTVALSAEAKKIQSILTKVYEKMYSRQPRDKNELVVFNWEKGSSSAERASSSANEQKSGDVLVRKQKDEGESQ